MRFSQISLATALAGAAVAIPTATTPLEARQIPALECANLRGGLHVIASGGANTPDPKTYGLLGSLAAKILDAIPGSTNVSMPYDKVFATMSPVPKLSPSAIPAGMQTLVNYINNYHYYCPDAKIALLGYSSGAIINLNVLCNNMISSALAGSTIIGTVSYGDETRVGGQSYDVGTCPAQYNGESPRANPQCAPWANSMQSYCDNTDPDCCTGSGNDVAVHLSYDNTYDSQATQFIVNAFKNSS